MIKKKASAQPLTPVSKGKLKAELYIFLQSKMKACLQEAVLETQRNNLHSDIVAQFEKIDLLRKDQKLESYYEDETTKFCRLAHEFDTVRDVENTERNCVNYFVQGNYDKLKLGEFAQICLRYGQQIKAEQYIYKMIDLLKYIDNDDRLFLASLMVQRNNYAEARMHLNIILD